MGLTTQSDNRLIFGSGTIHGPETFVVLFFCVSLLEVLIFQVHEFPDYLIERSTIATN